MRQPFACQWTLLTDTVRSILAGRRKAFGAKEAPRSLRLRAVGKCQMRRHPMKLRIIAGAGAFALALLGTSALTAPAWAANVPPGTKLAADQTFNFRMLDNPGSLDPNLVEDADTAYSIVNSLFEGLYSEDS